MEQNPLKSRNVATVAITALLAVLGFNQLDPGFDVLTAIEQMLWKDPEFLATVLIPGVSTFGIRLLDKIRSKTFTLKGILKDANSLAQLVTAFALLLMIIGIALPETAPQALADAIRTGSAMTIIAAVLSQVLTPLWYFILDLFKRKEDDPNGEQ